MFRPRPRISLLGLVLLVGLGILIERLVVTDTEAIEECLEAGRRAVERRDVEALRPLLADEFSWAGLGPDDAVRRLRREVDRNRPARIDVTWGPIVPAGDRCEVELKLGVFAYGGLYAARARVVFARTRAGWRVLEAYEG